MKTMKIQLERVEKKWRGLFGESDHTLLRDHGLFMKKMQKKQSTARSNTLELDTENAIMKQRNL